MVSPMDACHFRSWKHLAFVILEIRPLVLQGLLRGKYFQHNPFSFRYFLGPSNILSSDWMILSAYLLLGSAWMSFLTGCFVVCKVRGPRVTRIRCLPKVAAWVWHQILVISSYEGLTVCNDSFSCYSSCKEKSSSSTRNLRWPLVSGRKVESLNLETHVDQ